MLLNSLLIFYNRLFIFPEEILFLKKVFIYLWLCWGVATLGLSLIVVSGAAL